MGSSLRAMRGGWACGYHSAHCNPLARRSPGGASPSGLRRVRWLTNRRRSGAGGGPPLRITTARPARRAAREEGIRRRLPALPSVRQGPPAGSRSPARRPLVTCLLSPLRSPPAAALAGAIAHSATRRRNGRRRRHYCAGLRRYAHRAGISSPTRHFGLSVAGLSADRHVGRGGARV